MKYNQDNQLVGKDGKPAVYKNLDNKETIREKLPLTKQGRWRYNKVDWDTLKKKIPRRSDLWFLFRGRK